MEEGDRVRIVASGLIWGGDFFITGANGPNGVAQIAPADWPLEGAPKFALLVAVATPAAVLFLTPVFAGSFFDGTIGRPGPLRGGRLVLLINDDVPGGGSGFFLATISVFRR